MGDDLIRTKYELIMCKAFEDLQIKYKIYQIFCFNCNKTFHWRRSSLPVKCHVCNIFFRARSFARPDIIITNDKDRTAVIRVDGGIHEKKKIKANDFFQTEKFFKAGVQVFIVKNEDIDPRYNPTFQPHALALLFKKILDDPTLYDKIYTSSKYWKEHNRRL